MAKGGALFSAAAEPPPKQARTPTRRKLDMLASDDAASAREDDAVDEAVENAQLECATRAGTDVFANQANQNRPGVRLATERERVWRLLLGNVVRAVDEVYLLCEMECGAPEIEGTTSLLEACAADFKNLLIRVGDQEKFLAERERDKNADDASREAQALVRQQKTSISWDVGRVAARPSDASRDMIRAVVDADKKKDADKDAGWRPARGKRGERRRERDAGRARRRERRRSKTEDEIEKNDSDEPVLGQTSREDKREDKRIADRTRTRAFTPGSKLETRASRPPRPAASALSARAFSSAATEKKKPPVGTHDSAIPDDAQKRTDSRVDSVESLGSLSGKLAASGASASSFGSWADSDDDDALFHETPFPDARAPSSSAPSPPPAVWGAKRDWGAILVPAGAAMHAKLMSPDRKKKTPGETAALLLERQARATEARARAESERAERASRLRNGGDPAKPRPTAAEKETRAARAAERAAEQLEARHRRAEETREARIANLVKKASEETRKIEEIALLHSLDTANKKAALREKLAEAEKRCASVAEARRVAAEAEAKSRDAEASAHLWEERARSVRSDLEAAQTQLAEFRSALEEFQDAPPAPGAFEKDAERARAIAEAEQAARRADQAQRELEEVRRLAAEAARTGGARVAGARRFCLLYTSPSPRDATLSRMPSSA